MIEKENFHSFNALRFFSFLIVFLSHLPFGLFGKLNFIRIDGCLGVYFFFILSGFLITFILLNKKKVNFKKFFARRVLRIWPMYYLLLIFAFYSNFIISILKLNFSNIGYEPNWIISCFFLENYKIIYHNDFGRISPLPVLWSVCIEEHFYIIWGLLFVFFKKTKIIYLIIFVIIISYFSKYIFFLNGLMFKDILTNFDYFMYGAIVAYLMINHKQKTILIIDKCPIFIKFTIIFLSIVYVFSSSYIYNKYTSLIEPLIIGLLFTSVLLIFLPQENKFKISSKSIFSKFGVYTYSLYLNHVIVINLFVQIFKKLNFDLKNYYLIFIIICFVMSVLFSVISYNLIEKPFLNLKKYFM